MKPRIEIRRAALIGAIIALAGGIVSRIVTPDPTGPNSIAYWGGTMLSGAFFGIIIAATINRTRR